MECPHGSTGVRRCQGAQGGCSHAARSAGRLHQGSAGDASAGPPSAHQVSWQLLRTADRSVEIVLTSVYIVLLISC